MLNSLRSLRNSAAKKRAKVSASGSEADPDSPDSAVKLELVPDSPEQTSPSVTSPLSESGLSSLYSPPSPSGTKSSPVTSAVKPRVSSGRRVTADASARGVTQQEKSLSDGNVSVIGQRLVYSNRSLDPDEEKPSDMTSSSSSSSSPQIRATGRQPLRALRPAKGSQQRVSCSRDVSEGVIGRGEFTAVLLTADLKRSRSHPSLVFFLVSAGVFGSAVLPSRLSVASSPEQCDPAGKTHAFTSALVESDASPDPEELPVTQERVRLSRITSDKMHQRRLEQQDTPPAPDPVRRCVLIDDVRDASLNGCGSLSDESPSSPTGPQDPVKCLSPAHQPAPPPSLPNRNAAPRLRRVSSVNRIRPPARHSSDELISGSLKKEGQDQAELRPFSKPELALTQSFRLMSSDD
ncbi:hypothetical protein cypCar_00048600, partial [Cyprinus carpio]